MFSAIRASPFAYRAMPCQRIVVCRQLEVAEAAVAIGQRAPQDRDDRRRLERLEHVDLRARQQRRVHLEGRVLGRRADQDDVAGLDPRKEGVLLRLVEAMDLVDEKNGPAAAKAARFLRLGHHRADLLDPREDRAERDELARESTRDQPRQRRLARPRRTPEDDRAQAVVIDGFAQRTAGRRRARPARRTRRACAAACARQAAPCDRRQGFLAPPGRRTRTSVAPPAGERLRTDQRRGDRDVERFDRRRAWGS